MTNHRRSPDSPPSPYLGENQRSGWFSPACSHGSVEWEGASPQCGRRSCVMRWFFRYAFPILAFLIGIVVLGLTVWRVQVPECGPGGHHLGPDICVYD